MKNKLFSRDFSLVVAGQIVSILGSAVLRFALNLYVLDITGRADIFGLLIAVSAIPAIIFTPLGGAIADRFNRRNLMVIFDFSSSAVVLILIILLGIGYVPVYVVGIILVAISLISSMYQPAVQSSVPILVGEEQLASGNGVVTGVGALSGLLGPVLGGALYAVVGLNALVTASCAAFFLSAVMEVFICIPFTKQARDKGIIPTIKNDMKLGLRYSLREKPVIRKVMVLAAALNMLMTPFFIVGIPYILRITLNSSEKMYGIGMGIGEFSTILGAVLVGVITKKLKLSTLHRLLLVSSVFMLPIAFAVTPFFIGLGYWPPFVVLMIFSALITALATIISIFVITSVQKVTPNDMLGKIMAIIMAVAQCAAPLGMALYGIAFQFFNTAIYIPVLGACLCTFAITFAAKNMLKGADV
ncbi:MAG: MFS transporter [Clostridiales bacterium]|nr:MFS transporter [Clostridiales bacterium]